MELTHIWDSNLFYHQVNDEEKDEDNEREPLSNRIHIMNDNDKLNFKLIGKGENISNG